MSNDIMLGVTWLHRASKTVHKDSAIGNEIDYIASIFRYFSSEQTKKQIQGDK